MDLQAWGKEESQAFTVPEKTTVPQRTLWEKLPPAQPQFGLFPP